MHGRSLGCCALPTQQRMEQAAARKAEESNLDPEELAELEKKRAAQEEHERKKNRALHQLSKCVAWCMRARMDASSPVLRCVTSLSRLVVCLVLDCAHHYHNFTTPRHVRIAMHTHACGPCVYVWCWLCCRYGRSRLRGSSVSIATGKPRTRRRGRRSSMVSVRTISSRRKASKSPMKPLA